MGHGKKKRERKALEHLGALLDAGGYVPPCQECKGERVEVPASVVPAHIREGLQQRMNVEQFTHCPGCGNYSGLGGWEGF